MLWLDFTCYQKCRNRPFLGEICENFFAKRVGPNFRLFDERKKAEFLTFFLARNWVWGIFQNRVHKSAVLIRKSHISVRVYPRVG